MKKQVVLFAACLAVATTCLSFKPNQKANKMAVNAQMTDGVAIGTLHWVDPDDSALYQDFTVYVNIYDNSEVVGLKLVGTSAYAAATGTYDGTNVYNVFCSYYGANDIGGIIIP